MKKMLFVLLLLNSTLSGQNLELVKNIQNEIQHFNSDPFGFTEFNGKVFFIANDQLFGRELWFSDGTPEGSTLFRDIYPGRFSGMAPGTIKPMAVAGNQLFFLANNGDFGSALINSNTYTPQLWVSDGTPGGTQRASDLPREIVLFQGITAAENHVYFFVKNGTDFELWKSDGTEPGTVIVKTELKSVSGTPQSLRTAGNLFYFTTDKLNTPGNEGNKQLWRSDGTNNGTFILKEDIHENNTTWPFNNNTVTAIGNQLVFMARAGSSTAGFQEGIWSTNGTIGGTSLIEEPFNGTGNMVAGGAIMANSHAYLLFYELDKQQVSLWETDGLTTAGTNEIFHYEGSNSDFRTSTLTHTNDKFYFTGPAISQGTALFQYDYIAQTGGQVKDIDNNTVINSSEQTYCFANASGGIIVFLENGNHWVLWLSDGTNTGTLPQGIVHEFNTPRVFAGIGKLFIRMSNNLINETELWTFESVQNGLVLHDLNNHQDGIRIFDDLFATDNLVYFPATNEISGTDFWISDATPSGTKILKDFTDDFWLPADAALLGDQLIFVGQEAAFDREPWISDGTESGTKLLADLVPGFASQPETFTTVGNMVYFFDGGCGLWKTDGTTIGTSLVLDLSTWCFPLEATGSNDQLFFVTEGNAPSNHTLWQSDGTANGTAMIYGSDLIRNLTDVNGILFFLASSAEGNELWMSDGTMAGTIMVKDIRTGSVGSNPSDLYELNGELYFTADDGLHGRELWKSDGTANGTVMVMDIFPGEHNGVSDAQFYKHNGVLYFQAGDGNTGKELWSTDGVTTQLLVDVNAEGGSYPQNISIIDSIIYFAAYNITHGLELWKSDGTALGTSFVADVNPGPNNSLPQSFSSIGDKILFIASSAETGRELWTIDQNTTTAVDQARIPTSIFLSPNPTSGTINIQLDNFQNGPVSVTCYDLLGRLVQENHFTKTSEKWTKVLSLNMLSDGVYIIQINGAGFNISKKVLKNSN